MSRFHKQTWKGFTLVEAIIAIAIVMLVIAGATPVVLRSLSATDDVQNRLIATFLAQEGIQFARMQRDSNGIETLNGTVTDFDFNFDTTTSECFTDGCLFHPWQSPLNNTSWDDCGAGAGGCTDVLNLLGNAEYGYNNGFPTTPFTRTITLERFDFTENGTLQVVAPPTQGVASTPGAGLDARDDLLLVTSRVTYTTRGGIATDVTLRAYMLDIWRNEY